MGFKVITVKGMMEQLHHNHIIFGGNLLVPGQVRTQKSISETSFDGVSAVKNFLASSDRQRIFNVLVQQRFLIIRIVQY